MVKSPCISVCEFDSKNDLCKGCNRNGFEIFNWSSFSDEEKKSILLKLKERNISINSLNSSRKNAG